VTVDPAPPTVKLIGINSLGSQHACTAIWSIGRGGGNLAHVGGSGSGKTTLLRQMLGLDRPTEGRIEVLGTALSELGAEQLNALRRHSGVLFQRGALFSALTVAENVALPLRELRTFDEDLIRETVLLRLEMVGLSRADGSRGAGRVSGE
jgi:phospholipid/cholesterol/gamma-HCH transport system ATP-binding protein